MTIDPAQVAERLTLLRERLESLGGPEVAVLAVTKAFGLDAVTAACVNGLVEVGENYAQEMASKVSEARTVAAADPDSIFSQPASRPQWHFIGQVQSNKVKLIADSVAVWQSVDRVKVGRHIQQHAPGATVYVQMRPPSTGEHTPKGGAIPDEVPDLVAGLRDLGLVVDGIMSVGVQGDRAGTSEAFRLAVELADDLSLSQRSLGMSGDLDLAVEAGSTQVRVGTGLFGDRPPRG